MFTLLNLEFSILKMWKIKNVFTLGPMAHATLHYNENWKTKGVMPIYMASYMTVNYKHANHAF
jgi:hypothetical protein